MYTSISRIARIEQMNAERCRSLPTEADTSLLLRISVSARLYFFSILSITAARCSESIEVERIEHVLVAVTGGGYRGCVHTGCVLEQIADLGLDILRNGGVHVELHLGTAGKVDAQVEQVLAERQQDQRDQGRLRSVRQRYRSKTLKFLRIGKCFFSSLRSRRP